MIATERTIESRAFEKELIKLDKQVRVIPKACPLLVPLVETGEYRTRAAKLIIEGYLAPLLKKGIDTLVLGCTHYGILRRGIQKVTGKNVRIICESRIVPKKLSLYLKRHPEISMKLSKKSRVTCYTTDLTKNFQKLGSQFFGEEIRPKKVTLL